MAVVDLALFPGKPAKTSFELVEAGQAGSLIGCTLHTGRTHQIRVHLASLGCPLIDDEIYGGSAVIKPGRQALHASRLSFIHPVSQVHLRFHAGLPGDLTKLVSALGLRYNDPSEF
jgi:23S rRNA pseudouridine1911/1915/1917 synthase